MSVTYSTDIDIKAECERCNVSADHVIDICVRGKGYEACAKL